MDDFLFVVFCFIAIAIAVPWISIVLFPVFLTIASGLMARQIAAEAVIFLKFKSRLYRDLLRHLKNTNQPQKVCACLYRHQNQLHLGVQFTSKQGCWSHHVKGTSFDSIEARIHDKLERHPHQPKQLTHYPCASKAICPSLPRRRRHQPARKLLTVRFQTQLIGLAALELGTIAIIWIALSTF